MVVIAHQVKGERSESAGQKVLLQKFLPLTDVRPYHVWFQRETTWCSDGRFRPCGEQSHSPRFLGRGGEGGSDASDNPQRGPHNYTPFWGSLITISLYFPRIAQTSQATLPRSKSSTPPF
jgi:hypothetical protein